MADELQVSGGAGGVEARVDDMRLRADIGDGVAEHLGDAARQLSQLVTDLDVVATLPLSPGTGARAQGQAATAAAQVTASMLQVRVRTAQLRLRANAVERADQAVWIGSEIHATGTGILALGRGLETTVFATPVWFGVHLARGTGSAFRTGNDEGLDAFWAALGEVPGNARVATVEQLTAYWSDLVLESPQVVDAVVDTVTALASLGAGRHLDQPGFIRSLLGLADLVGTVQDPALTVGPASLDDISPRAAVDTRIPSGFEDLIRNQASLMAAASADPDSSRIRVIEVPGPQGSQWIVQIPGTQALSGGSNPADFGTNLHLSGYQDAAMLDAVEEVLRSHGVGDDPVMLVGHSQGGIAATNLAARTGPDAVNITNVVTFGSPIAHVEVSEHVQVLALEHTNDIVPRVDGRADRDRFNVTTVRRDPGGSEVFDKVTGPHDSAEYYDTAAMVDASTDPSITAFREDAARFFDDERQFGSQAIESGRITDHTIRRE